MNSNIYKDDDIINNDNFNDFNNNIETVILDKIENCQNYLSNFLNIKIKIKKFI